MEREQALDILERFDFFQGQRAGRELWNDKPFDVQEADIAKFSQDVALLKNYIKELTDENERLKSEVSVKRKLLDKAEVRIECVEEENNQLKADICNAEMNLWHITEDNQAKDETIANLIETIKTIQADTIEEYRQKVNIKMGKHTHLLGKEYVQRILREVKKEMKGE